jgi:hypothetical protein
VAVTGQRVELRPTVPGFTGEKVVTVPTGAREKRPTSNASKEAARSEVQRETASDSMSKVLILALRTLFKVRERLHPLKTVER